MDSLYKVPGFEKWQQLGDSASLTESGRLSAMQKIGWSKKLKEFQWSALSAFIAALALTIIGLLLTIIVCSSGWAFLHSCPVLLVSLPMLWIGVRSLRRFRW